MMLTWRRFSDAGPRSRAMAAVSTEAAAVVLQATFRSCSTPPSSISPSPPISPSSRSTKSTSAPCSVAWREPFQRIAMSLGDGLICTDSNYLITVWNTGAAAMFGYRAEDMIGKPFEAICAESGTTAVGQRRRRLTPAPWSSSTAGAAMVKCFRWRPAFPVGRVPRDISLARSCATSRCASARRKNQVSCRIRHVDRARQSLHARRQACRNDRPRRGRHARLRSWLSVSMVSSRSTTCLATPMATWCCEPLPSGWGCKSAAGRRARRFPETSSPSRSAAPTRPRA